jgi:dynamin family protein
MPANHQQQQQQQHMQQQQQQPGEDSYEAFVRRSISDMDRDLRFFDANVLDIIDKRFFGDCHDVFQHFRSQIHEAFGSQDSVADLQFDFKRAWLAGLLQHCEQPKRQQDASEMLAYIQGQKAGRAVLQQRKSALGEADMKDFDEASQALLGVLEQMRKMHEDLLRANAQFPGSVSEADLQHLERWEEQRESLEERAKSRGHSVAVIGLEKAGKSTVCNALIGMRLLPAAVERCTMLTTRIRPSADDEYRMEVTFTDEAAFEQALGAAADAFDRKQRELDEARAANDPDYVAPRRRAQYDAAAVRLQCQSMVGSEPVTLEGRDEITEALKRYTASIDTMLAVRTVTVWTPELSADNVEIVDVPGFDSPLAEHREAAARSLNESDAFLFVTNGAANVDLTAPALELVRTISKVAPGALDKGYAIVTHLDSCSSRAEFNERRTKAVRRLVELGFNEARIFCACPPLALMEKERATGAAAGETREHYEEVLRKARRYGVQLGFAQLRASLEEFVSNDLPLRRRREALTLSRLAERAAATTSERLGERLKTFLPADQLAKLRVIDGRMNAEAVDEIMASIETGIARTHNAQWTHLWANIWAHVNSSAADWLAANYFDRFDELSAEWTRLFHEHYDSEKAKHSRELYGKFKSRLSVLPMVLEEPDPCDAEMAHRVWLVDTVHRTLTAAASRVARSIYEVLQQYHDQLSTRCFAKYTDDVEHLGMTVAPLAVTESAVRLKIEFNTLQAARLLEKRVLRYPSWHPRRELREQTAPIPGLYDAADEHAPRQGEVTPSPTPSAQQRTALAMGAAGTPQGFPRAKQPDYRAAEEAEQMNEMLGGAAAARQPAALLGEGLKAKRMGRNFFRRKSVQSTTLRVTEGEDGQHYVCAAGGTKLRLPVRDLEIREGIASSKSFDALGAQAKEQFATRALALRAGKQELDIVVDDADEYRRTVDTLRELHARDAEAARAAAEAAAAAEPDVAEDIVVGAAPAGTTSAAVAAAEEEEAVDEEEKHAGDDADAAAGTTTGGTAEENDMRALRKGLRIRKMPHARNGSVRKTRLHVDERPEGSVIMYDSRNKWAGDIEIPLSEVRVVEGPAADSFGKLGPKGKADAAERSLSIEGRSRRLDVVFDTADDYERAVRGLRAMQSAEGQAEPAETAAAAADASAAPAPVSVTVA